LSLEDKQLNQLLLFSSSVFKTNLSSVDNNKLITCVEKLMHEDLKGRVVSNRGGWQSRSYSYTENQEFISLFDNIIDYIRLTINQVHIKCEKFLISYWINVNNKYSYNTRHTHVGNILSGVYYIKTPKNSGGITFYNPKGEAINLLVYNDLTTENRYLYTIDPKEKDLLLFDSFLEHQVEQNLTEEIDDRRISIAFNIHE
jgi:uncharacterized protein (TIGR02466 family)